MLGDWWGLGINPHLPPPPLSQLCLPHALGLSFLSMAFCTACARAGRLPTPWEGGYERLPTTTATMPTILYTKLPSWRRKVSPFLLLPLSFSLSLSLLPIFSYYLPPCLSLFPLFSLLPNLLSPPGCLLLPVPSVPFSFQHICVTYVYLNVYVCGQYTKLVLGLLTCLCVNKKRLTWACLGQEGAQGRQVGGSAPIWNKKKKKRRALWLFVPF